MTFFLWNARRFSFYKSPFGYHTVFEIGELRVLLLIVFILFFMRIQSLLEYLTRNKRVDSFKNITIYHIIDVLYFQKKEKKTTLRKYIFFNNYIEIIYILIP